MVVRDFASTRSCQRRMSRSAATIILGDPRSRSRCSAATEARVRIGPVAPADRLASGVTAHTRVILRIGSVSNPYYAASFRFDRFDRCARASPTFASALVDFTQAAGWMKEIDAAVTDFAFSACYKWPARHDPGSRCAYWNLSGNRQFACRTPRRAWFAFDRARVAARLHRRRRRAGRRAALHPGQPRAWAGLRVGERARVRLAASSSLLAIREKRSWGMTAGAAPERIEENPDPQQHAGRSGPPRRQCLHRQPARAGDRRCALCAWHLCLERPRSRAIQLPRVQLHCGRGSHRRRAARGVARLGHLAAQTAPTLAAA